MAGQNSIDFSNEATNTQARDIADSLDSGDAQYATEALRRASFEMGPEQFNKLVTAVEHMEQPQTGADIVLKPVDASGGDWAYSNQYDQRTYGKHQNSPQSRHGLNGRYKVDETMISMTEPGQYEGEFYTANLAVMRTRVDHLAAFPQHANATEVAANIVPDQNVLEHGAQIAQMLDTGYTNDALEFLRRETFSGDASKFAQKVFAINNFEQQRTGADLTFTAVDTGDNYFNMRPRQFGHNQNRGRYRDGFHQQRYPISDTLVSVVMPNGSGAADGTQNDFLKADIAIVSTSLEPMDAIRRPNR